jgi:hypothetical protein
VNFRLNFGRGFVGSRFLVGTPVTVGDAKTLRLGLRLGLVLEQVQLRVFLGRSSSSRKIRKIRKMVEIFHRPCYKQQCSSTTCARKKRRCLFKILDRSQVIHGIIFHYSWEYSFDLSWGSSSERVKFNYHYYDYSSSTGMSERSYPLPPLLRTKAKREEGGVQGLVAWCDLLPPPFGLLLLMTLSTYFVGTALSYLAHGPAYWLTGWDSGRSTPSTPLKLRLLLALLLLLLRTKIKMAVANRPSGQPTI